MASRSGARNNILAGAFLLVCLLLAVATSFILSDAASRLTRTNKYNVRFSLDQGAVGLKVGSAVLLAGQQVGRVTSVTVAKSSLAPAPGQPAVETPVGIDVAVNVRSDITLYENALFSLERPLLGTLTTINISNIGSPVGLATFQGSSPRLEPSETINGSLAPPGFLAQAGLGPEQVKQIKLVIADTQTAVSRLAKLLDENSPAIGSSVDHLKAIVTDAREKWPKWSGDADAILANLEKASGNAVDGSADAKASLADIRKLIDNNSTRIDSIIANADSAVGKVNNESIALANDALRDGRQAMQSLRSTTDRADTLLAEQTPNVRRTLANIRLASDQMKLVMAEIRAAPWRVLFRPTTKEQETELLYDAVRAYATATSDLRAAGESLESALGSDGSSAALDRATLEQLTESLRSKFSRYQAAEQSLFDRMLKQSGGSPPAPLSADSVPGAEPDEPARPARK